MKQSLKIILVSFVVILLIVTGASYELGLFSSSQTGNKGTNLPPVPGGSVLVLSQNVTLDKNNGFVQEYQFTIGYNISSLQYVLQGSISNITKISTSRPSGPGSQETAGPGSYSSFSCFNTAGHEILEPGAYAITLQSEGYDNFSLKAYVKATAGG
ncbi:MAG: hypothetical protein ACP5OC_08255 [Thermoplasmata archaeon]